MVRGQEAGSGDLDHGDAGRNERARERINRQGELLERHGAEQREASRGSEQAGRVEGPVVDGEQDLGRRPLFLASVRQDDGYTPLGGQPQGLELRRGETGEHGAGVHEELHLNGGRAPARIGNESRMRERTHRHEL